MNWYTVVRISSSRSSGLKFQVFKTLEEIDIQDYSCTTIKDFTVQQNSYLKKISIGSDCFTEASINNLKDYNYQLKYIKKEEVGTFFISFNYYLESICIGKQSFMSCSRFSLSRTL